MKLTEKHFLAIEVLKEMMEGDDYHQFTFGTGILKPRETAIYPHDFADTFNPEDCEIRDTHKYEDGTVLHVAKATVNGSAYESVFNSDAYDEWIRMWSE